MDDLFFLVTKEFKSGQVTLQVVAAPFRSTVEKTFQDPPPQVPPTAGASHLQATRKEEEFFEGEGAGRGGRDRDRDRERLAPGAGCDRLMGGRDVPATGAPGWARGCGRRAWFTGR